MGIEPPLLDSPLPVCEHVGSWILVFGVPQYQAAEVGVSASIVAGLGHGESSMILVISSSLHPDSRSRILARACVDRLTALGENPQLFDLSRSPLPQCDGAAAYSDPNVKQLGSLIQEASAIVIAAPVYNYDVNSAAKNAVELTGRAWTGKVVGMMLAAGGQGSYMSAMGLANSLMLDFRCLIVPRFIYATGDSFEGDRLADDNMQNRVELLVDETLRIARAVVE